MTRIAIVGLLFGATLAVAPARGADKDLATFSLLAGVVLMLFMSVVLK